MLNIKENGCTFERCNSVKFVFASYLKEVYSNRNKFLTFSDSFSEADNPFIDNEPSDMDIQFAILSALNGVGVSDIPTCNNALMSKFESELVTVKLLLMN